MNGCRTVLQWLGRAAVMSVGTLIFGAAMQAQSVTSVPNAVRYAGVGTNGPSFNTDLGAATGTRLAGPTGLAFDGAGNLIIADRNNNCVRRLDTTSSRTVSTIVGLLTSSGSDTCDSSGNPAPAPSQGLIAPSAVAADSVGNIYIADTGHNCVRELPVGQSGVSRLIAIAGTCGSSPALSATPVPASLALDKAGSLYILTRDTGAGVYQVLRRGADGALCRVAGAPSSQGVGQCSDVNNTVTLNGASGIAFDGGGALYIADTNNDCVRTLAGGSFSTVLGTCGVAGSAISRPSAITFGLSGAMFVASTLNNQVLRYNQNTGALVLIAGNADTTPGAFAATQDGTASTAVPLNAPAGLVEDSNSNLFLADAGNNIVRELRNGNLFGSVTVGQSSPQQLLTFQISQDSNLTVAASPEYRVVPGTDTCTGLHTAGVQPPAFCSVSLRFQPTSPGNRNGPLTISDSFSGTSVTVGLQGVGVGPWAELLPGQVDTFASGLGTILALASDSLGNEYALAQPASGQAQVLRYPAGGGAPTVFVGPGRGMKSPVAIALDAAGNLFVADTAGSSSGAPSIQRYGVDGAVNTDYITGIQAPAALQVDGFGNMVVAEQGTANDVLKIFLAGGRSVLAGGGGSTPSDGANATSVRLGTPSGLALAPGGNVYISDAGLHTVFSVDAQGTLHTVAGTGAVAATPPGGEVARALAEAISSPAGLSVDAAGDLYIVDTAGNRVFLYFPASDRAANLLPILGTGVAGNTGDGAVSTSATVSAPTAVSVTPDGVVHVADAGNGAIRAITFPSQTLDFGSVAVGSSPRRTQAFVNTGNTNLVRTLDPSVTTGPFSYNPGNTTCSSIVVYGQLCTFAFNFRPVTTGPASATATIADNAPTSPHTVHLTGNAVPAAITGFAASAETETYGGPYTGTALFTTNGGTAPSGTVTFTVNGTVTCSVTGTFAGTATCTLPGGTLLPVQTSPYPVAVTFTGNYPAQSASTTLTVMPRTLKEKVDDQSKGYLEPNPPLSGVPNSVLHGIGSDTFTVAYGFGATPITTGTLPGVYTDDITATVTPSAATVASNYNIVVVPGTFTITKGSLPGLGASSQTEIYGSPYTATASFSAAPGAAVPSGTVAFSNGANVLCTAPASAPSCTVAAGTRLAVGNYPITVTYSGDSTYAPASATTSLTVTPAPLTVTVADQTKAFGAAVPNLTGSATLSGLVNGDAVGSTIILTYSTTVTASSPVGTYPGSITVTVGGTSAGNYTVSNIPGTFTVGGTASGMTLTASAPSVGAGVAVTFTATVTSTGAVPSGTVVFTSDSVVLGSTALDGNGTAALTTTSLPVGTHTIRASYAGNASFASSSATLVETVTAPTGSFTITAATAPQYIRGPGSRTFSFTVTSAGGFAGTVSLACSGLPADASCTFDKPAVMLAAGTSQTVVMTTTTTTADSSLARAVSPQGKPGSSGGHAVTAVAAIPFGMAGLGLLLAGFRRRTVKLHGLVLVLLLCVGLAALAGCGAASYYHIYPVTVTGSSVAGGPAASSATVYLGVGTP